MFERYTERARRVIFFARYEASAYGSTTIQTEHLLLGLVREDKNLTNRFLRPVGDIRSKVEERIAKGPRISTSIDLPLTDACKRILAYASEEADRLGHSHLGTEHLLLGMLRETDGMAARLLTEAGIQIEPLRDELARSAADRGNPPGNAFPPADRPSLHELIDQIPEHDLPRVSWMLARRLSDSGMHMPIGGPLRGILERLRSRIDAASFRRDAAGKIKEGRTSSSRYEDGAIVVETHQFCNGHQISVTESFQMSGDGKTLSYSQEVIGPRTDQQHKHSMQFDVS